MKIVGLIKAENGFVTNVQCIESKFERELGETMTVDNIKYKVAVIGAERDSVINALNDIIKKQNKIVRAERRLEDKAANATLANIVCAAADTVTKRLNF